MKLLKKVRSGPFHLLLPLLVDVTVILGRSARCEVVGAAVLPHGDFALDPSLVNYSNGSVDVHNACISAAAYLEALRPDVIILSTPHGIELGEQFSWYTNSKGRGHADIGKDLHDPSVQPYRVELSAHLAPKLATILAAQLGHNNTALKAYGDSEPVPLRWGEVIPLQFMRPLMEHTQVAILSHPLRRYDRSVEMIPGMSKLFDGPELGGSSDLPTSPTELLHLGRTLGEALTELKERVAVLISSDLAHTHDASGPYGFSVAAEPFDRACGRWAANLDGPSLLSEAASYVQDAKSCGFTGLVMLHGLLNATGDWAPELLVNEHPTYYGMMVATFRRRGGCLTSVPWSRTESMKPF